MKATNSVNSIHADVHHNFYWRLHVLSKTLALFGDLQGIFSDIWPQEQSCPQVQSWLAK